MQIGQSLSAYEFSYREAIYLIGVILTRTRLSDDAVRERDSRKTTKTTNNKRKSMTSRRARE